MLDIKFIRQNPELVKKAAKDKQTQIDLDQLLALDERKRHVMTELEAKRAEQNKRSGEKPSPEEIEALKKFKDEIKILGEELGRAEEELNKLLWAVPNIPSADTPVGSDASANKVIRQWGKLPSFNFKPKEHWQLGKELDIIDTEKAAEVSGTRFSYLKGDLVFLEFALVQYALAALTDEDILKKIIKKAGLKIPAKPFVPVMPPVMIRPNVFQKMARLEPKEERYYVASDDIYLVGSAEHTLGPLHLGETIPENQLPIRYVGFSTAFRREAGSYGKDVKGILRVHQFDKVEMESFTVSENSVDEQNFFVAIQEYLMQSLELPYQVVMICTGDMGGPDARQIDIETWLPGQNQYRETHTADLMTDYQARRLNTRVKRSNKNDFVHMNDP
ncbi:MAG: serine--tRNA ligase, partial [Patescibacteria group bacterium]